MRLAPSADEIRHAWRALSRSPGFVATAVLSLALSIALSVTMFGIVDTLTHPRVAFDRQDDLISLTYATVPPLTIDPVEALHTAIGRSGVVVDTTSTSSFAYGMPVMPSESGEVSTGQFVSVRTVQPNYFTVMGLHPFAGRFLIRSDLDEQTEIPAVMSYRLWRQFAGTRKTFAPFVGRIDTLSLTFVGVLPEHTPGADVLVLRSQQSPKRRPQFEASVIARLKPGTSHRSLTAALDRINADLMARGGKNSNESRLWAVPVVTGDIRVDGLTLAFTAATLAILLVACANIANLHLARGLARLRELAVRSALGASRGDVMRLLIAEAGLVAALGGLASVLLSWWLMYVVRHLLPPSVKSLGFVDPVISWRLLLAGLGLTASCVALFGLLPAIRVSRLDVNDLLKSRMAVGDGRRQRHHYRVLVACEVAGAMALGIVAALLMRSTIRVRSFDFGFDTQPLASAMVGVRRQRGEVPDSTIWGGLLSVADQLRSQPGVTAVGLLRPAYRVGDTLSTDDPDPVRAQQKVLGVNVLAVSSDLLRSLDIAILDGVNFTSGDLSDTPVAIVDSAIAARLWYGASPIGKSLRLAPRVLGPKYASIESPWMKVIGVARHVRFDMQRDLSRGDGLNVFVLRNDRYRSPAQLFVRTAGDPRALVPGIRGLIASRPPFFLAEVGPFDVLSGRQSLVEVQTFVGSTFFAFALFGLGLAMVGVYGVVNHSVVQRRREFGLRIALGATPSRVMRHVLDDGNAPVLLGVAAGLIAANWGYGVVTRFLIAHTPGEDLTIFTLGAAGMLLTALSAMLGPAIRAVRVNPVEALRSD